MLLIVVVALAFGQIAVGRPLAGFDVTTYSTPNRVQVTEALRHGHLPQWDPYRFGGSPLLANPQAAVLYPLHWALLVVPVARLQGVSLVLHVLIGALGMYALARRRLRVSPPAAVVGGIAFALGGFVHAHIGHYEQTTAIAWVPIVLAFADRVATEARAAVAIAGLAVSVALLALAGHTQYLHMGIVAVGAYSLVVARPFRRVGHVAVGVALGLGLAAVQLLPTALASRQSVRAGGLSVAEASLMDVPLHWVVSVFVSPDWNRLAVEVWAWLPWTALALALLAVCTVGAHGANDRRVVALVAVAVVGVVLAVGQSTPVFAAAHRIVPGMKFFRVPGRWLLLPTVAVPLLATIGFDALARRAVLTRWRAVGAVAVAVVMFAALATQTGGPSLLAAAVGAALVAQVGLVAWLPRPPLRALLVAAVVVEALVANHDAYVRWLRMDPGMLVDRSATAAMIDGDGGQGRVLSIGNEDLGDHTAQRRALRPNAHVFDRLRSVDGYDGGLLVTPAWHAAMIALTHDPSLVADTARGSLGRAPLDETRFAELDTTHVVAHGVGVDPLTVLPPGSSRVGAVGDVAVYRTPTLGPVFLDDGTVPRGLRLHRDRTRPERLVVDVPPTARGRTVVVSEALAPGWRAPAGVRLQPHHDLLMSFVAPAGADRVVLRYRTPGLRGGLLVTLVSALAIAALLVVDRRRR